MNDPAKTRGTPKPLPDRDYLMTLLSYSPKKGEFRWKVQMGKGRVGAIAGTTVDPRGYRRIRINAQNCQVHRLAWLFVHNEDPVSKTIDHINGDPGDNRISNLRLATSSENQRNSKRMKNNTSGVKGVFWDTKKGLWSTRVTVHRKRYFLGDFQTIEAAEIAVTVGRRILHGEFGRQK